MDFNNIDETQRINLMDGDMKARLAAIQARRKKPSIVPSSAPTPSKSISANGTQSQTQISPTDQIQDQSNQNVQNSNIPPPLSSNTTNYIPNPITDSNAIRNSINTNDSNSNQLITSRKSITSTDSSTQSTTTLPSSSTIPTPTPQLRQHSTPNNNLPTNHSLDLTDQIDNNNSIDQDGTNNDNNQYSMHDYSFSELPTAHNHENLQKSDETVPAQEDGKNHIDDGPKVFKDDQLAGEFDPYIDALVIDDTSSDEYDDTMNTTTGAADIIDLLDSDDDNDVKYTQNTKNSTLPRNFQDKDIDPHSFLAQFTTKHSKLHPNTSGNDMGDNSNSRSITDDDNENDNNDDYQGNNNQNNQDEGLGFISLTNQQRIVADQRDARLGLINPTTMHNYLPTFLPPWIPNDKIELYHYYHSSVFTRLHNEILHFVNFLKPTQNELKIRSNLIKRLATITQELFPGSSLEVFGSSSTNTQLPFGDVDLVLHKDPQHFERNALESRQRAIEHQIREINNNPPGVKPHTQVPECMFSRNIFNLLGMFLQQKDLATDIEIISKARIPVMKFIDTETGLNVDITLNTATGVEAAAFMTEQMTFFPQLHPLTMVIKYLLHIRGLNDAFTGGVGSFVIQCMLISMLQRHPARFKEQHLKFVEHSEKTEEYWKEMKKIQDCEQNSDPPNNQENSLTTTTPSSKGSTDVNSKIISSMEKTIRRRQPQRVPVINTSISNLGLLLFSFFQQYSFEIDYHSIRMDISGAGSISRRPAAKSGGGAAFLSLLNPLDLSHDMTANSFNFHTIRQAFLQCYNTILSHIIVADPVSYDFLTSTNNNNQNTKTPSKNTQNSKNDQIASNRLNRPNQITSTLLSELLPTCPDLVDSRPDSFPLPKNFIDPRNIINLNSFTTRTFNQHVQEYLSRLANDREWEKRKGGEGARSQYDGRYVRNISPSEETEIQSFDQRMMARIDCTDPDKIDLDPVQVYFLIKKAFSTPVLQFNELYYSEGVETTKTVQEMLRQVSKSGQVKQIDEEKTDKNEPKELSKSQKKKERKREAQRMKELEDSVRTQAQVEATDRALAYAQKTTAQPHIIATNATKADKKSIENIKNVENNENNVHENDFNKNIQTKVQQTVESDTPFDDIYHTIPTSITFTPVDTITSAMTEDIVDVVDKNDHTSTNDKTIVPSTEMTDIPTNDKINQIESQIVKVVGNTDDGDVEMGKKGQDGNNTDDVAKDTIDNDPATHIGVDQNGIQNAQSTATTPSSIPVVVHITAPTTTTATTTTTVLPIAADIISPTTTLLPFPTAIMNHTEGDDDGYDFATLDSINTPAPLKLKLKRSKNNEANTNGENEQNTLSSRSSIDLNKQLQHLTQMVTEFVDDNSASLSKDQVVDGNTTTSPIDPQDADLFTTIPEIIPQTHRKPLVDYEPFSLDSMIIKAFNGKIPNNIEPTTLNLWPNNHTQKDIQIISSYLEKCKKNRSSLPSAFCSEKGSNNSNSTKIKTSQQSQHSGDNGDDSVVLSSSDLIQVRLLYSNYSKFFQEKWHSFLRLARLINTSLGNGAKIWNKFGLDKTQFDTLLHKDNSSNFSFSSYSHIIHQFPFQTLHYESIFSTGVLTKSPEAQRRKVKTSMLTTLNRIFAIPNEIFIFKSQIQNSLERVERQRHNYYNSTGLSAKTTTTEIPSKPNPTPSKQTPKSTPKLQNQKCQNRRQVVVMLRPMISMALVVK